MKLRPGDRLLICTDGLWGVLPETDLKDLMGQGRNLSSITRRLLQAGSEAKAQDDTTVIVLSVEALDEALPNHLSPDYDLRACLGRNNFATIYGGLRSRSGSTNHTQGSSYRSFGSACPQKLCPRC